METKNTMLAIRFDFEVDKDFIEKFNKINIVEKNQEGADEMSRLILDKTGIAIQRDYALKDNMFMIDSWVIDSISGRDGKNYFCTTFGIRQENEQFEAIKNDLCLKMLDIAASYGIDELFISELKKRYL